jgi:hypothetical protein
MHAPGGNSIDDGSWLSSLPRTSGARERYLEFSDVAYREVPRQAACGRANVAAENAYQDGWEVTRLGVCKPLPHVA